MNRKQQTLLKRILLAVAGYAAILIFQKSGAAEALRTPAWLIGVLFLLPYLLVGREVILKALKNIRNGQVFDENFLMLIATVAAFCIGEYSEAATVAMSIKKFSSKTWPFRMFFSAFKMTSRPTRR